MPRAATGRAADHNTQKARRTSVGSTADRRVRLIIPIERRPVAGRSTRDLPCTDDCTACARCNWARAPTGQARPEVLKPPAGLGLECTGKLKPHNPIYEFGAKVSVTATQARAVCHLCPAAAGQSSRRSLAQPGKRTHRDRAAPCRCRLSPNGRFKVSTSKQPPCRSNARCGRGCSSSR
jgi:hypothetical protein